jgi:hypothetical protein
MKSGTAETVALEMTTVSAILGSAGSSRWGVCWDSSLAGIGIPTAYLDGDEGRSRTAASRPATITAKVTARETIVVFMLSI